MSRFPAAFPLPALAFWSSCSRRGIGRSLRSAYQCAGDGLDLGRGFRVSHARAAIGVGALSTPGTTVLALTGVAHRPALAASQRRVPALRHDIASMRSSALRSITKGSRVFTRPIFPLPVAPGCNGSVLGFTPSFAPRPCGRRTSTWGQVIEHGPETTLYVIDLASNPALFSQCVRPRVARDNAEAAASGTSPLQVLRDLAVVPGRRSMRRDAPVAGGAAGAAGQHRIPPPGHHGGGSGRHGSSRGLATSCCAPRAGAVGHTVARLQSPECAFQLAMERSARPVGTEALCCAAERLGGSWTWSPANGAARHDPATGWIP